MAAFGHRLILVAALALPVAWQPAAVANDDLVMLLQNRQCPRCQLADVDLMHVDLRDADLSNAELQRANLSRASLDGADLSGADLSFTSLQGASLRGSNLQGAKLYGTDLRNSDLSGAQLDNNALEAAHWTGSSGLPAGAQSHAALHNAGVSAAQSNNWKQAEKMFGLAIQNQPESAESWVARGIAREQLGKRQAAIQDFRYAGSLLQIRGDRMNAKQLKNAADSLQEKVHKREGGNGMGSTILNGLLSTSKALLPLAMKMFMPAIGF